MDFHEILYWVVSIKFTYSNLVKTGQQYRTVYMKACMCFYASLSVVLNTYILIGKRSKSSKSCREEYPVHFFVSLALLDIFELFSTALSQLENFCTYFDQTLYWSSLNISLISYTTFMRQNQKLPFTNRENSPILLLR